MLRFRRLGSSTLYLGEALDSSTGHLGDALLVLPSQTPMPPSVMSLQEAWDFQHPSLGAGYLLFLEQGHDLSNLSSDQVTGMAARLHSLLPRVVREQHLSLGWVRGNPQTPSTVQVQILAMVRAGGGVRTQNIPQAIRFQQIELMVLPGTPFRLLSDSSGFELENTEYLAPPGADPRMDQPTKRRVYLRGAAAYDIDKVGERITIPLMGGDRGSLQFDVSGLNADDMDAGTLDTALYYVVPEPEAGRDQSLRFPFMRLNPTGDAVRELDFRARLFPANPMSSVLDFGAGNGTDSPLVQSFYTTHHGYPVYLAPQSGAGLMFSQVPNPGVYPSRSAEVRDHYCFVPVGNFEMVLDRPLINGETYARLIGGQSGTEYVSFKPRVNGTRGDVLCFFRGGSAYAPDFSLDDEDGNDNNGTLLTNRFTTSWLSVGLHPTVSQNGHIPQYFAQPDDAALHGEKAASDPYLEFVEVPTVDLPDPSLADSFPLAPLSGVIAPDDRISRWVDMEKYVHFEKSVLNPYRKATITGIKRTTHASVSGRVLQQGQERSTTTPQGMLVDVDGSDWTKLTLAKDDSTAVNYLQFSDVSADFQDALMSNRLFLVATNEDELTEDGSDFHRLLEIAEWPFRFDIGQPPLGLTEVPGEYNNVLIFKFVNSTLEDLVEDTRLWARPDQFNDDADAIQQWLKDYIQDVRDKVEAAGDDAEALALYKPLLTIIDNPNWTGILGLNVTIPPSGMPCEVQGLMGGIRKMSDFKAHHIGFAISKVLPDASDIEKSSIFALLDYGDTDPPETIDQDGINYEFVVRKLQVRFANSEVASFDSDVRVFMNELFHEPVAAGSKNFVDLVGSYDQVDGVPQYSFSTPKNFIPQTITFVGSTDFGITLMQSVSITKASLVAGECATGGNTTVTSAFHFNGSIAFRNAFSFDFFSFDKLMFTAMKLHMAFDFVSTNGGEPLPTLPTFEFDPGDLGLNVGLSQPRLGSLLANFPLRLNAFHYNEAGIEPTKMGYFEIPSLVPGWNGAEKPIYGLSFTIDMGPLSSILKKGAPKGAIEILAAWEPAGGGVTFGITLGKGANGKKELGIEGVFLISLSDFGFQKIYDGDDYIYCFFLSNAFLKIFSTQIPPGGNFSLVLFVPFNGESDKVNLSNLGWFISYQTGTGAASAGSDPQTTVTLAITANPSAPTRGQNVTFTVTATNQMPISVQNTVRMSIASTAGAGGGASDISSRPLPPAPQSLTKFLGGGQGSGSNTATYSFTWPANQVGDFTVTATAAAAGSDGGQQNNGRGTGTLALTVAAATGDDSPSNKKKTSILKVEYLGLGARVQIPGVVAADNSVEKMIARMKTGMTVTGSGDALQRQLTSIYNPNAGLVIAFDLTILEFVRLAVVFAQENQIYGGLIGFAERAPAFIKGLQFQILYKRVTDSIGVFHILLKLPDYLRRWDIGKGTLTLPIIGIDIYTNGNFKLDLGFPYDFDFSRSLTLEIIIWLGKIPIPLVISAGLYFSYLTGATSSLVPKLTENLPANPDENPMFDPVFEAGLGLQIGIGREMNYGVLKAGALIALVAMLEGAMAWYWPNGRTGTGKPEFNRFPDWFRVSGQAGLIGKIYGHVDFKVIKASVNVELRAIFHFIFETYKDILFGLTITVKVSASIKIAFVRISFSFNAKFGFEFSIPNPMGPAPWSNHLANPTSQPITRSLLQANLQQFVPGDWVVPATDTLLPASNLDLHYTVAVTSGRDNGSAEAYAVALLTMAESDGERLVEALTRWAIWVQVGGAATVTLLDLETLDSRLNPQPEAGSALGVPEQLIPYATLASFLDTTFGTIEISSAPASGDHASVIFPMPPVVSLVSNEGLDRSLSAPEYLRGEDYHDDLAAYFEMLMVDVLDKSDLTTNSNRVLDSNHQAPLAQTVFEDYFEMLLKGGVGQAVQWARDSGSESFSVNELMAEMYDPANVEDSTNTPFLNALHMASRYFAHGLRIPGDFTNPDPVQQSESAQALYALTGQQVPIPESLSVDNADWTLSLIASSGGWFTVDGTPTYVLDSYNGDGDAEGWLATLQSAGEIGNIYSLINPERMDPLRSEPKKFAFKPRTIVQAGDTNPASFHYPLSDVMLQALDTATVPQITLYNPGGTQPIEFGNYVWSLRVPFMARRVSRTQTETTGAGEQQEITSNELLVPNVYEILGTDEATRALIERSFTYLEPGNPPTGVSGMRLHYRLFGFDDTLFRPAGDPRYASIMKTNLSTISAPQQISLQQFGTIAPDEYAADLVTDNNQAYRALRLIYEASIVNASGFYLAYDNGAADDDESGFPDEAFQGAENLATLVLEVQFDAPVPGINTLSVLDPAFEGDALYAEIAGEQSWLPVLAPGAVAFELLRTRPNEDHDPETDAAAYLSNMFQLLSYRLLDNADFNPSIRGLPVGPLDEDGVAEWVYREGIKVNRFQKSGDSLQRYSAVGKTALLQLEFLDVFGNELPSGNGTPPALDLPVQYADPLIPVSGWPGIGLSYTISQAGSLSVSLEFDYQSYLDDEALASNETEREEFRKRREAATDDYRRVLEQLNGPHVQVLLGTSITNNGEEPQSLDVVRSFIEGIIGFLSVPGSPWNPPAPAQTILTLTTPVSVSNPNRIFPVRVWVAIDRVAHVIPEWELNPDIKMVRTYIPTDATVEIGNDEQHALEEFATDFEAAFGGFKVATGLGADGPHTIWAVDLRSGSGLGFDPPGSPFFYAPPPLSKILRSREAVPIRSSFAEVQTEIEGTVHTAGSPASFTEIDMDIWGREFLQAVDRLLSPAMAATARRVAPVPFEDIMDAKASIAAAIASSVTWIIDAPGSDGATPVEAARDGYRQQLLASLGSAYDVETAIVFPVQTHGGAAFAFPPRAYGNVTGMPVGWSHDQNSSDPRSGFTLTTAKIDLSGATEFVPVLFSSGRTRSFAAANIDVKFAFTHVEHDIAEADTDEYQASSWLTLVLPNGPESFGDPIDVPIPLREFPLSPELAGQEATAAFPDSATNLAEAKMWDYQYFINQPAVAQDTTISTIDFNVPTLTTNRSLLSHDLELIDWLARFHREYPLFVDRLELLTKGLRALDEDDQITSVREAVTWFANIIKGAGDTWQAWVNEQALGTRFMLNNGSALLPYTWSYQFEERIDFGSQTSVIQLGANSTRQDLFPVQAPRFRVMLEDGSMADASHNPGSPHQYTYPWSGNDLMEYRPQTLIVDGLDVLNTENAWGSIRLLRNLNLSSGESVRSTNDRFVYETAEARFVNKVTPLLDTIVPINLWPGDSQKALDQHLRDTLTSLFNTADAGDSSIPRLLKIGVRYAYDVRGQGGAAEGPDQNDEYIAYMPVLQRMPFNIAPTAGNITFDGQGYVGINEFVGVLTSEIQSWRSTINPSTSRAYYEIDLSVFAALSQTDLPVLRLRRLWLGLDKVSG